MNDRILVTGGLGFIGSHFIWHNNSCIEQMVVIDNKSSGIPAILPSRIQVYEGDIGNSKLVSSIIKKHNLNGMVHFAGKIQVGESILNPRKYFDNNVSQSISLINTAIESGINKIVFSSSAAVYGNQNPTPIEETGVLDPINPYGMSKLSIEYLLNSYGAAYGLRWAALRYFNAAGANPNANLKENHDSESHLIPLVIDAALEKIPPITIFGDDYPTYDGSCIRDYIHVSDLAEAHYQTLLTLDNQNIGPINIGTGIGFSVFEIIEHAERIIRKKVPHSISGRRIGDPVNLIASNVKTENIIQWTPKFSGLPNIIESAFLSRK